MLHLRPVVVTVLLGLLLTMTQAPASADHAFSAPQAPSSPPMPSELFSLNGQVPVQGGQPRLVHLQRYEGGQWRTVRSRTSAGDGSYSIPERISVSMWFRVAVGNSGGLGPAQSHTVKVQVVPQHVAAWIKRICTGNTCGDQAEVAGYVRPVRANRLVTLQYKSGSSWKSTSKKGRTDANGNFAMTFGIAGWSQWRAKQLRIVAGSYAYAPAAASAPISFMPGPTRLGRNVLRVDVAGGAYPRRKGVDYTGVATLSRDGQVLVNRAGLDKFGVRGSTTAGYPKKPYNLRFQTSQPVFGMDPDRRWTLLAMYADQSFVRDKTALDLGRKLVATGKGMTWNPDSEYVELFVNSQYMGAYLMTEKVDIDGDRVAVDQDTGMIMEVDMDTVSDPRKGFRSARGGLVFAFKEPDGFGGSEGITSAKLSAIKNKVASIESYLYTTNRRYWYKQIEGNSAADFHLAVEYFKDIDADFWRSKYFTWDRDNTCGSRLCDGRLHFGPLWDFDKSVGNVDPTNPGTAFTRSHRGWAANGTGVGKTNRVTYHTHWFVQLWKVPSFRAHLAKRWNDDELRVEFWRAAKYEVDRNKALIGWGAANDRKRWAGSAKLYAPKGRTYDDEVRYVKSWLLNRFNWMDSQL